MCAHHFTCDCLDWISQKLLCQHVDLTCLPRQVEDEPPSPASPAAADTAEAETEESPGASLDPQLPSPPAGSPAVPPSPQTVVSELREVLLLAQSMQDTMSEDTCRQLMSEVDKLKQMLTSEASSRTSTTGLSVPTARIEPQPSSEIERTCRVAPSTAVICDQDFIAKRTVHDSKASGIVLVKYPRVHGATLCVLRQPLIKIVKQARSVQRDSSE